MNEHERAKFDELLDAGVPPQEAADRAREITEPEDSAAGIAIGCVMLVALLLVVAACLGAAAFVGSW